MSTDSAADNPFADFKLWYYTPSIAASVIFTIVFLGLTCYHAFKLFRNRTWFCVPFFVGGLFETVGYAARAAAYNDTESLGPYIIQSLLLLIAPVLFAASVYMILGRIVLNTNAAHLSLIRPTWLTKIFVTGDIFCFCIQGAGGGLLATAKTKEEVDRNNNIILGGLILQVLIFLVFLTVSAMFHTRLRKDPTAASSAMQWQRFMYMLYGTSILITVRNLYRIVEYVEGYGGYLLTHEWSLYVFDAILMAAVLAIGILWYDTGIKSVKQSKNGAHIMMEEGRPGSEERFATKDNRGHQGPWS